MAKSRAEPELPPCYAMVHSGLEAVAADEIELGLKGEVKRTGPGFIVFRAPKIDDSILRLRTTEDVFLYAWGTDALTYRDADLESIRRWTAREVDWPRLLRIHQEIRPKPKSRPTYHLVTQMTGEHGYLRKDAREALARGLAGKFPETWRYAEENASVEVWLTINGKTAICGLRLSDRTMRHRTYKIEHQPASLRPTMAAAMVRLAEMRPGQVVVDPMCGAGTILAETLVVLGESRHPSTVCGGDIDRASVRLATANLRRLGRPMLYRWDAATLPLADAAVDRIVSNPPFGKQLSRPEEIGQLYRRMICEYDRVLKPKGRAVLLVSDYAPLRSAAQDVGWRSERSLRVRVLGQPAVISVWRKAELSATIPANGAPSPSHL
jgi:tRNA (guanine6-N2)-methyltransferase